MNKVPLDGRLHRARSEDGAVLAMLAILALVIVIFLALAVDTARLGASKQQQKRTSQFAALSALEKYREQTSGTHADKLAAAVNRAEEVAGFTRNALLGRPGEAQLNAAADDLGASGAAGEVVPGEYYFDEPEGSCADYNAGGGRNDANGCPCLSGTWSGPCFRPAAVGESDARAFQVRLATKSSSPIANVFGRVFGQKEVALTSWGAAAMVPRHGAYPIDLSSSMAEETHIPIEATQADLSRASYYVFRLTNRACPANGALNPCVADGSGCVFPTQDYNDVWYGRAGSPGRPAMAGLLANRPASAQPRWRHYRDDYTSWSVALEDFNNDGTLDTACYLIDTHVHSYDNGGGDTGYYRGPEPLSSVLGGLQEALATIENRSVAGDRIAIFGFDTVVQPIRRFDDTYPGKPDYQDLIDIVTLPTSGNRQSAGDPQTIKRIEKGYFPVPGGGTDIVEAILTAGNVLKAMPNSRTAQAYVALFTDGLPTCYHGNPSGDYRDFIYDDNGTPTLYEDNCKIPASDSPGMYCPTWNWRSAWNNLWDALGEASTLVSGTYPNKSPMENGWLPYLQRAGYQTFVERKIAFNAVIFGARTEPHTMLLKNGSRCANDGEARKAGDAENYVTSAEEQWTTIRPTSDDWIQYNQTCYRRMSDGENCPFYLPQQWFYESMVVPTGGFYVPVRRPCDLTRINSEFAKSYTLAQCRTTNVVQQEIIDPACAAASATEVTGTSGTLPKLLAAGVTNNFMGAKPTCNADGSNPSYGPPQFGQHRLICDPNCLDIETQIRDFIRKLYAQNPYILVRANGE